MKMDVMALLKTSSWRMGMCALSMAWGLAHAQNTLNVYTARHYQTDQALYDQFTKATGIRIQRIEGKEDELLERLVREGQGSPADVFITVDAARLSKATDMQVLAPLPKSTILNKIPAHLRTDHWVGFSTRARLMVYNPKMVAVDTIQTYGDLAHPRLKNKVCVRSGSHPYNLSLVSSIIARDGSDQAEAWVRGLVQNFARVPKGGDTDQIKGVASGECGVALVNSYYLARILASKKLDEQELAKSIAWVWPDQRNGKGSHINISGGGVARYAKNPVAALKFLEYLTSDDAQRYFADGNNEWPVMPHVKVQNAALQKMGSFKADALRVADLAKHIAQAQKMVDRAGWR